MDIVGVLGTIGYSRIGFALIAGALLGDAYPDTMAVLGIVSIVLAATLASYQYR